MAIQGLNATCTIQRRVQGSDDVVGGAVVTFVDIYTNVLCRIASIRSIFVDVADQGLETGKAFQMVIWPTTYTIYEGDRVEITAPAGHEFINQQFLVNSVMIDSISPNDSRGHIELYMNRYERSRSVA